MDDFDLELKQSFIEEAMQGLDDSEKAFLALEQNSDDPEILDELFRLAHNLKGTSMAVGFDEVGDFTHKMEDLILKVKEGDIPISESIIGILLECNDHLRVMIEGLSENLEATFDSTELITKIQNAHLNTSEPSVQEEPEEVEAIEPSAEAFEEVPSADSFQEPPSAEAFQEAPVEVTPPVEVSPEETASIESPVETPQVEDTPPPLPELATPAPKAKPKAKPAAKKLQVDESVRVSLSRLEKLNNYVGELVILQNVLSQNRHEPDSQMMHKSLAQLSKLSKEIHEISMSLRMLPVKPVLQKLQRVVRDTSKALDKKVNLVLSGEETEIDKTVLEHLNDPLIHIVRNAIDHGLESKEKRIANGKDEVGNVEIKCFHQGNNLVIEVKDDGGGVPPDIIRAKAIEKGVISENSNMSEDDIIQLIFHPGFSTKEQVSEVSGRGVGMDVVKTNINSLSGDVRVISKLGEGTTFQIVLPLTMAIIDGMIAEVDHQKFVLPLSQVHETVIVTHDNVDYVTGSGEYLNLRGQTLPLFRLGHILNKRQTRDEKIAVIVDVNGTFYALTVDDILTQQQVVVKNLGEEVSCSANFMGSSILGDGMPALILDLQEITKNIKPLIIKKPQSKEALAS